MGLTAIVSSTASAASASSASSASASAASTSVASLLSPVGFGIGGVVVAAALIFLLGYFDVLDATDDANQGVRTMLVASIIPLGLAFGGVVLFQTLSML